MIYEFAGFTFNLAHVVCIYPCAPANAALRVMTTGGLVEVPLRSPDDRAKVAEFCDVLWNVVPNE